MTREPSSGTSARSTVPAATTVPYPTRSGPTAPPWPPRKIGGWSSMTPRGTSPNSDAVVLSPSGVKLKWTYELPTSLWSRRLVPPAIRQSQKLTRLPRVTKGNRIVCLSPTQWAPLDASSRMVPPRTWAPSPMLDPARKTEPWW